LARLAKRQCAFQICRQVAPCIAASVLANIPHDAFG
jgi:hypothetical protein